MRQIILDTETTGLDPKRGDRVVEIACVEILERRQTGRSFHKYINPERDMPEEAYKVHGLSNDFLADKPLFKDIADEFIAFIDGAELVIHNAAFDVGFLDAELDQLGAHYGKIRDRCAVEDSLTLARQRFPGQRNSLDALCKRLGVDNSGRDLHGALIDADLLCQVYLNLTAGQQEFFGESAESAAPQRQQAMAPRYDIGDAPGEARPGVRISDDELAAHAARLEKLRKKAGSVFWDSTTA